MSNTQQKTQPFFQKIGEWLAIVWCLSFIFFFLNLGNKGLFEAWLIFGLLVFVYGLINFFLKPRSHLLIAITIIIGIILIMFLAFALLFGGLGSAL